MQKTILTIVMGVFCLIFKAEAQTSAPPIQPLKIGDKIPEAIWKLPLQVVNHPEGKQTITLNDYKGKLIILDFGTTFCPPCLISIINLEKLKLHFPGQLDVLPISPEKEAIVSSYLIRQKLNIPHVVNERTLYKYFPHKIMPQLVWIMDGKVKAISDAEHATAENIGNMLSGKETQIPVKQDLLQFDASKPLLVNGNGGNGENLYQQSVFTGFIDGMAAEHMMTNKVICIANASPLNLFKAAYQKELGNLRSDGQIIFELPDSLKEKITMNQMLSSSEQLKWHRKNGICYNLYVAAPLSKKETLEMMKQDLNRFFKQRSGITANYQTRRVKCLVLHRTAVNDKLKTNGNKTMPKVIANDIYLQNKPMSALIYILAFSLRDSLMPVIDATEYSGNINLIINTKLKGLTAMNTELKKYDLELTEQYAETGMLVISDKNKEAAK